MIDTIDSRDTGKKIYYYQINRFAIKCLELNPEDPTAESMEFANGENFCTNAEAFAYTSSLQEATGQNASYPDDEYKENVIAIDCIDWDICKRIREIQTSDKEYKSQLDEGSTLEFIDGTLIDDIDDLVDYRNKHEQPYRDNLVRSN